MLGLCGDASESVGKAPGGEEHDKKPVVLKFLSRVTSILLNFCFPDHNLALRRTVDMILRQD